MSSKRRADEARAALAERYPRTFGDWSAEREAKLTERLSAARAVAEEAAELLKRSFAATRVVVFGSLAQTERFTEWSDIDLAAWGIPPHRYYAAVAAVTGLSTEFKIDLIDGEACPASLLKAIEREGIEL